MGMILQKHGRLTKDKIVSMGTISMEIFKVAILLLLNDFISFLLIPISHPMALLWLCEGLRWILIQVNPRSAGPKEQVGQDKNIILGRRASSMFNWCPF